MLHSFLFATFDDPAHQAHYAAVQEALYQAAATETEPTLLLGNFVVADEAFDAVVIRPRSITALLFGVGPGELAIRDLTQEDGWQVGGQPVANLLRAFQRQQSVLAAWLGTDLSSAPIQAADITGVVLFSSSVTFGPTVEPQLRRQPETESFQLLREARHLPRRLWPLARPGINLPSAALLSWAQELAEEEPATDGSLAGEMAELVAPMGFWEERARQLWRWLGAEDIPLDAPYGGYPPADAATARHDEKQRLEQIQQQVRAELHAQTQATAAREAERDQTIAALQAQLRQASAKAPETTTLQARLAAEIQEKDALREAVRTAQAESAARNAQLDARIEQLGQLMQQLHQQPVAAAPASFPAPAPAAARPAGPGSAAGAAPRRPAVVARPASHWQLRWNRLAVVAAVAGGLGWAAWGAMHIARELTHKDPTPTQTAKPRRSPAPQPTEAEPEPDAAQLQADSLEAAAEARQQAEEAQDSAAETEVPTAPTDSSEVLLPTAEPELDDTSAPRN